MQLKKIVIGFIIGYIILAIPFFLLVFYPDLIYKDKIFISQEEEPPRNLNANLDPNHDYYLSIRVHYGRYHEIKIELKLDNSTFDNLTSIGRRKTGMSMLNCEIPIENGSTGFLEIIVLETDSVNSVEYNIFMDIPKSYIFFYDYFFIIIPSSFSLLTIIYAISFVFYKKRN
jgi:hypothetical protein